MSCSDSILKRLWALSASLSLVVKSKEKEDANGGQEVRAKIPAAPPNTRIITNEAHFA
jgi:hypothetical protein